MERMESLSKLFEELGCKVESHVVLNKCLQLCESYNVDMEKFTELWLTFCISNDKEIEPTIDILAQMENTVLKTDCKIRNTTTENNTNQERATQDEQFITNRTVENDNDDVCVLSMYGCAETDLSKQAIGWQSPDVKNCMDIQTVKQEITEYPLLPANHTENSNTPTRQHAVTGKGKNLLSTGETITSWKRVGNYNVEVVKSDEPHVSNDVKYMYEILSKEGYILTFLCRSLGSRLFQIWSAMGNADIRYAMNIRSISQTHFRTFGRISTKKESANIVTLEGCTRRKGASAADAIELDFRNLKHYSVFPGQVVAVEAINPVGDALYVKDIFAKAYAQPAPVPKIESNINIFVAAGPFTVSNNMHYQPLWDLMERVASDEPHVLILIGPFLEFTHSEIQDNLIQDTHQEFFEKILIRITESARKNTQIVLVASNRDAHHEPVFPTPQYTVFNRKLLQNTPNLILMPDPCILDIKGLRIGVTSIDVIKHIGKEEISNISGMDRLSRLADHILAQTCFYPVYPPSDDLNVDIALWEKYAFFDQQPHLLIIPSDMRCFCKVINECITLNPERMHKQIYAKLRITPAVDGKWSSENVSCEISKLS